MTKTKQSQTALKNTTVLFGYGLFALILVNVTLSTIIPWLGVINTPHVRLVNAWTILIACVAGAVLPVLISYLLGGRATHDENKASHHFNSVLFAISYLVLRKSQPSRLMRALVAIAALTMGLVALDVASQLAFGVFSSGPYVVPMVASAVFGLVAWGGYVVVKRKAS